MIQFRPGLYDHLRGKNHDLGDGLTEAELYHWARIKRSENQLHRDIGHERKYGFCRLCDNCLCGRMKQFICRCAEGKKQVSPYRIRFQRSRDAVRAGMKLPDHG